LEKFDAEDEILSLRIKEEFKSWDSRVILTPVSPWGAFVPALNAGLAVAAKENFRFIIYQSLEVFTSTSEIKLLLSYFKDGIKKIFFHYFFPIFNPYNH